MNWTPHTDRNAAFWIKFPHPRGDLAFYADVWSNRHWRWDWIVTRRGIEIARGEAADLFAAKNAATHAWEMA